EASHSVRLVRRAEQLAEHPVGVRAAEGDHDDIAGPAKLDGDVKHPVVSRVSERGHGSTRNSRTRKDRAHVAAQQPGAPLRLVHGRDAELRQSVDDLERRALDVAYSYVLHGFTPWKCFEPRLSRNGSERAERRRPKSASINE